MQQKENENKMGNSRIIKFRAWHPITNQMLPDAQTGVIRTFTKDGSYLASECIYMQYTGLKDKNGVEIYEGDIVNWLCKYSEDYGGDAEIVFDNAEWVASTGRTSGSDFYDYDGRQFVWSELRVIGNIYENPELLK